MQFSFKRPQTSKSVSTFYKEKLNEKSQLKNSLELPQSDHPADETRRWEAAAQRINKDMIIQRILHANGEPFRMLSKLGGKQYSSQPKLDLPDISSRPRNSSKDRTRSRVLPPSRMPEPEQAAKAVAQPLQSSSNGLRRRRRGEEGKGRGLQRELKAGTIFYESPVIKIGYNMQYEAHLRTEHISLIRPDHGGTICRNSIIFFLKDAPFSPNIISEKNEQLPIALSLFPEFYDSKLSLSHARRQKYLSGMLAQMNGTYDPERMAKMPKFSNYLPFEPARFMETARMLMTSNEANYKEEWLNGIVKKVKGLSLQDIRKLLREQWDFFNMGNAISTLDYLLKDPKTVGNMNLSPYLATRVISSKNVLYHGGYCKSIYVSWNGYVENGRKKLAGRLRKYHSTTQAIHGWYTLFEELQLYEKDFLKLINESVSIELFRRVQLVKIRFGVAILKNIWFRGVLTLYHHNRMLMREQGEYDSLLGYASSLAPYVREAKERAKELKNSEEVVNFYLNFYENFISTLHKAGRLQQMEELMVGSQLNCSSPPEIANVEVLLNLQFGRTIEKSFLSLQQQIMQCPQQPLLRLTLIIDRQSIKFLEQEEDIVNSFLEVMQGILGVSIQGFELNLKFDANEQPQQQRMRRTDINLEKQLKNTKTSSEVQAQPLARHYAEISEKSERSSLSQQRHFWLKYKTAFNFEDSIKAMVVRIREYYQECFVVLGEFEVYLPFIKLTTTQKIFQELQGSSVEESFLKNLSIIAKYRQSLERLGRLVRINLFEVNCELPIRILQERIREIEYIIEQNYLNIIHEKMEGLDSELNSLKIAIHDAALNPTEPEQLELRLAGFRTALFQAHAKTQRIAQMVLFCLENKRKADTVTTCYCQLVGKKQELHREVERLANQLELTRPHLQAELEQEARKVSAEMDRLLHRLHDIETTCFEFSNLPEYILTLKELQLHFQQLRSQMDRVEEGNRKCTGGRSSLGDRVQLCHREQERLALAVQYWESFYRFETYFKEISKQEAGRVEFGEFSSQLESSEKVVGSLKDVEAEWWRGAGRASWKQIIHGTHDYYSRKFAADLQLCRQAQPQLRILTNRKIRERHWRLYNLEEFRNVSFRELGRAELTSRQQELEHMNQQVNFEHEILLSYEAIEKEMRAHRLLVVDLNNSDVLDLENVADCLEFLHNVGIEIEATIRRDVRGYLRGELGELLKVAGETEKRLGEWQAVEREYIRFIRYHLANEDYEHGLFDDLAELHRKLIKSYDIDNSILFISKNIVMESYLSQIKDSLTELSLRLSLSLTTVRSDYPRLYLLNDQQLLDFMSSGADVPRYLKKCLPCISAFGLREGAIERVGNGRGLSFAEPLYIQEMLGRVQVWVAQLEDLIRMRMKEHYKTSLILSEGSGTAELQDNFYQKYPLQLAILQDYLKFTQQAEIALTDHTLAVLLKQIEGKMEEQIKERREVWKLLVQLVFRDMVSALMRVEGVGIHSYEWSRLPQFHRKAGLLQPRLTILHQEYVYGFNYLEDCDLIYTDSVLTGNCVIGQANTGKTALVKHTAYLCGQELLIFNPYTLDIRPVLTRALLDHFKVAIHAGSWLYLRRADRLDEEQLKLAAECMAAMQDAVKCGSSRLSLSGQSLPLNRNTRVFLSLPTLQMRLPGRLCGQIRPIWVVAPSARVLLQHYLQSKCVGSVEVGRVLRFCSWLDRHGELLLEVVSWIRSQDNPDLFTGSQLYRRLAESHIFSSADCVALLDNLKREDGKVVEDNALVLSEELRKYREVLIFGQPGIGKTTAIIQSLAGEEWMLLDAHTYLTIDDFYEVIKAVQQAQPKVAYVLLKNSLPHYSLIKQHLGAYRIVLIEHSLAHLHQALLQQLHIINYAEFLPKNGALISRLVPSVFTSRQECEVSLILGGDSLFVKIIGDLEEAVGEGISIAQLHIHFLTLLKAMLKEEYELSVAFLFCVFWTYGQHVEDKRLEHILDSSLPEQTQTKFKKITNNNSRRSEEWLIATIREVLGSGRLVPLAELLPLKKGKFMRNMEGNDLLTVRQIQIFQAKPVTLHSNLMHNLGLVRQIFPSTMLIQSRDWLTTLLNITVGQPRKFFNFSHLPPTSIFSQLFHSIQRKGFTYNFGGTHILIDDLYLCPDRSQAQLQSLLDYGFALAPQPKPTRLSLWKLRGAILTVGTKWGQPNESKALLIRISEASLGSLFNEYVQCFCERWLAVDRSVFCLLNLSHNIVRLYREQDSRYYWFKNPLLLLQQASAATLTCFVQDYLSYLMDMLPDQMETLANHRAMLELPVAEEMETTEEVINTNQKYSRFYEQSVLVERLVADHEVLAEIQGKQVESIFFERFIRNYFTRDILDYVRKLAQRILHHHLLLLPDNYPHAQRIAAYACKLAGRSLHIYHPSQPLPSQEAAVWIDLDQFGEPAVRELQDAVKLKRKAGSGHRFIIKASLQSEQTRSLLQAYPFLKTYFLAVVLKSESEKIEHSQSSKNIIEENYEGSRYVERLEQLIKREGLDCNFRDQFMRVYELNRRRELAKFQFYRKITSEMIVNLDLLALAYRNAPLKQVALRSQAQSIKAARKKDTEEGSQLRARLSKCCHKAEVLVELVRSREEEQNGCLSRLIQSTTPLFTKMEKAERRIEAIESVEFTRLKNNLKNNENNAAVQPIHQLLAYLLDKAEPKQRAQPLSCLTSPQALVAAFRQLRVRENYNSDREKPTATTPSEECIGSKRISTGMAGSRLKTLLSRIQEVEGQGKKFEKVSLIYKSIMGWLGLFQQVCQHLKEYYERNEESDSRLTNALVRLNQQLGEQPDPELQKRNLEALAIGSQQQIEHIQQRLHQLDSSCKSAEADEQRLAHLEAFYAGRESRLARISSLLTQSEYMKKISSSVSLYFKNMEGLVFEQSLMRLSLNQWLEEDGADGQLCFGIFTFRSDVHCLREKYGSVGSHPEELQILNDLFQDDTRALSLIEDRNGLLKAKLAQIAQDKRFLVKEVKHTDSPTILELVSSKLADAQKVLLLHQNIHYLETQHNDREFSSQLIRQLQLAARNRRIIYVANYLPALPSQLYSLCNFGKAVVSRQRFFCDLTQVFGVLALRDQAEPDSTKRRTDIATVVSERNSKMKELMANIELLAGSLQAQPVVEQEQAESERCEHLENNLGNLSKLEEQLECAQRNTTSWTYLSAASRDLVSKELQRYYLLYQFSDHCNCTSSSQFFSSASFYPDWLSLLKDLREENISLFTRVDHRPVISQIVVSPDGISEQKPAEDLHASRVEEDHIHADQVLNRCFRLHNLQIFNLLVEKLCKNAHWVERPALLQFAMGAAVLLALPSHHPTLHKAVIQFLKEPASACHQQAIGRCAAIASLLDSKESQPIELQLSKLITQLNDPLGKSAADTPLATILYLYQLVLMQPHNQLPYLFLSRLGSTGRSKWACARSAIAVKALGEVALKVGSAGNLSLSLEGRVSERQKVVTIIEEEKYLLDDLVEVLRIKALSRKRQLVSLLVDGSCTSDLLEQIRQYHTSGRHWVLLANISVSESLHRKQSGKLLAEILKEIGRLGCNPYFRLFVVLEKESESDCGYYNKYEISKLKSYHQLSVQQYCKAVNQIALDSYPRHPGKSLMEHLIVATLGDESHTALISSRLEEIYVFYSSLIKKHRIFDQQDFNIYYRILVAELTRLGYLKAEQNEHNFYTFLGHYFGQLPVLQAQQVKQLIQIESELSKEGITAGTILRQDENLIADAKVTLQYISHLKLNQYLKTVCPEFAALIKSQVMLNNLLISRQNASKAVVDCPWVSKTMRQRSMRILEEDCERIKQGMPLLRLLSGVRLKQISVTKQIQITSSQQFFILLAGFMLKQLKQLLVKGQQGRLSAGFGGFSSAREYLTRMKIVLIDSQSYQEFALKEEDLQSALLNRSNRQSNFIIAIRKAPITKISELNYEEEEINKLLQKFVIHLSMNEETTITFSQK